MVGYIRICGDKSDIRGQIVLNIENIDNPDIMEQADIQWQTEAHMVSEAYWTLVGNTCQWCGMATDMIIPRKTDNTGIWFLCGDCVHNCNM
jgi:hypothetical protein